jgi:polyisoprenoid-binding protein YceI
VRVIFRRGASNAGREKTMRLYSLRRIFAAAKSASRVALLCILALPAMLVPAAAQTAPVFAVAQQASTIKFAVSASMSVTGTFDKWNAGLICASADPATCVLDIKIQADSVNTGSGLKDHALKGEDFFDVAHNPQITFHSTKFAQTATGTFEMSGDFTLRGVTKQEKLTLTVSGAGTGAGIVKGTMSFNRKDYGVNGSIPLVHIADRVDVTVDLKVNRISGPALAFKN